MLTWDVRCQMRCFRCPMYLLYIALSAIHTYSSFVPFPIVFVPIAPMLLMRCLVPVLPQHSHNVPEAPTTPPRHCLIPKAPNSVPWALGTTSLSFGFLVAPLHKLLAPPHIPNPSSFVALHPTHLWSMHLKYVSPLSVWGHWNQLWYQINF